MKVQRPHLPPLNTTVHRLEDGMIILSGPVPSERECEGRRLERLIASAERVFVFLLACLDVGFAGRRSIQRFFVEWRLKHDSRAYTYAGVALIFGVLLSRGQLRPVVPQPVHSWSLALFLLGMASASWVVSTWYALGAAIFRPVFPRTVTLPFSQAQQIEEGLEQAYKRNETLHKGKVKVLAELEQRRLISNRARKLGLPATLKLPEYLITVEDSSNYCSYCQRAPSEVIEHALPLVRGYQEGGTTFGHCFPACRAGNAETSHTHPHQEGGRK